MNENKPNGSKKTIYFKKYSKVHGSSFPTNEKYGNQKTGPFKKTEENGIWIEIMMNVRRMWFSRRPTTIHRQQGHHADVGRSQ